ncbi:MAG: hypothetical protein LBG44_05050 [Gemmatimonadota bacterium]|jgi:hypothetical protein|nr:hypothetical protein [Gemmatimonadota bacterium]
MKTVIMLVLMVMGAGGQPRPVMAQQLGRAAIGGAAGLAGGTVITLSVIVARARFQNAYLDSVDDLVHWQTLPLIITPAVGAFLGWTSDEALRGSIVGSVSGLAIGTVAGAGIGWLVSSRAEAPWAGGVIGAGAGLAIGGIAMGVRGWIRAHNDDAGGVPVVVRVAL